MIIAFIVVPLLLVIFWWRSTDVQERSMKEMAKRELEQEAIARKSFDQQPQD